MKRTGRRDGPRALGLLARRRGDGTRLAGTMASPPGRPDSGRIGVTLAAALAIAALALLTPGVVSRPILAVDASPAPSASLDPSASPMPSGTPAPTDSPTPFAPTPTPAPTSAATPTAAPTVLTPPPAPSVDPSPSPSSPASTSPPSTAPTGGPTPAPDPSAAPAPSASASTGPTASPSPTPTPLPSPVAVTVVQTSDAPSAGLHRIEPGARLHLTITVTPADALPDGLLVETLPAGWGAVDLGGGTLDPTARTVTWSLVDLAAGSPVSHVLDLVAPTLPLPDGSTTAASSFAAQVVQAAGTTSAQPLDVLVAPAVLVGEPVLAAVDAQTLQATYLATGAALAGMQRFEALRVRFVLSNPDGVPADWSPQLEWARAGSGSFGAVPADALQPGVPFYVAAEWRPAAGGGSEEGPRSEPIPAQDPGGQGTGDATTATGYRSMGPNPIPAFQLPAGGRAVVEFSLRTTVDATYLASYDLRLTDAGHPLAAAAEALVTMGPQPAVSLTAGQYAGVSAHASQPSSQRPAASPTASPVASPAPAAAVSPVVARLAYGASSPTGPAYPLRQPSAAELLPRAPSAIAYPLQADAFASPHGPYSLTADECAACHSSHVAQGSDLVVRPPTQSNLCFTCHDGSNAGTNVQATFADPGIPANDASTSSYYQHPVNGGSGTTPHLSADANEWQDASGNPISNRHSECADCHNPHRATSTAASPTSGGWTLSGPLAGTSGVVLTNGAAGSSPSYQWAINAAAGSTTLEYQLCLKCHSGFTSLPNQPADFPAQPSRWELDKAVELNPASGSSHPVEGAGTNQTAAMAGSLAGTSPYKLWTFAVGDTVRCVNCHGDPTKATPANPPAAGSDLAVHASPYRGLLMQNYRDRTLKSAVEPYSAADFALCFECHAEAPFRDTTGNVRSDTNFRYHGLHVSSLQGAGAGGTGIDTPGAGQGDAICAECHFRVHGTATAVTADQRSNSRLVNFAPNVGSNPNAWTPTGVGSGTCSLTCHGESHSYGYTTTAAPLTLVVTASPTTYSQAGDVIRYSYVITNTGGAALTGPFTVSDSRVTNVSCVPTLSLSPGATDTCSGSLTVLASDVSAGSITTTATAYNAGHQYASNHARTTVTTALSLTATASPATFPGAGTTLTFSYTVWNLGTTTLSGPFAVTSSRTGTIAACGGAANLAPGASTTCLGTTTTTQGDTDAGSLTDTARASNATLSSGSTTTTVATTLALQTFALDASYAAAGDVVHYSYLVTNAGAAPLAGTPVLNGAKGTVDCSSVSGLAAGASGICSGSYTVTAADVSAGSVTNAPYATLGGTRSNVSSAIVYRAP